MKAFTEWTVLKHRPWVKHSPHLWSVEGTMPKPGVRRVMSVARMADGRLVIHNAIALEEPAMKELEAWGTPTFLVVPNGFHRMDARIFKDRYPALTVLCPNAATKKVAEVVTLGGTYVQFPKDPRVTLRHLEGLGGREGIMEVNDETGHHAVVNDVLMNVKPVPGMMGLFLGPTGRLAVPRFAKWFLAKDRYALAMDLKALAARPTLRTVVMSHGDAMVSEAGPMLDRAVGETLLG